MNEPTNEPTNQTASNPEPGAQPPAASPATPPADDSLLSAGGTGDKAAQPSGEAPPEEQEALVPDSPEGYSFEFDKDTQVDTELLGQFQQWAHANKIPVENAKDLAKAYEAQILARIKATPEMRAKALEQQRQEFYQQTMNDPIFSKDLNANVQAMDKGFKEFAEDGLKELLQEYGLNTHPLVTKTFLKIGQALAEPDFITGVHAGGNKSAAEVLYPNLK